MHPPRRTSRDPEIIPICPCFATTTRKRHPRLHSDGALEAEHVVMDEIVLGCPSILGVVRKKANVRLRHCGRRRNPATEIPMA
jgi:hypothetical protein